MFIILCVLIKKMSAGLRRSYYSYYIIYILFLFLPIRFPVVLRFFENVSLKLTPYM